MSLDWFAGGQQPGAFETLLNRLHLDPQAVAIAVSRNVALSGAPLPFGPPVTGFHTAFLATGSDGIQRVQTAIWADYTDPYPVAEFPGLIANTTVLSHEVAEWLHDPFLSNVVPAWRSPLPLSSFFYGCSQLLETGDAVSEVAFTVDGYQLSDEAFFSWFAREAPSRGINGQYTYLGTFTRPSPPC